MQLEAVTTSLIPEHEHRASEILPPEMALKKAANLVQIGKPINMLLQNYPSLHQACLSLASIMTHLFPSSGEKPLLSVALAEGLAAYRHGAKEGSGLPDLPVLFLKALIERAMDITSYDVRAVNGMGEGERWETLRTPLSSWIASHPDMRIVFTERDSDQTERRAASVMLIGQILTMRDASLLTKYLGKVVSA